MPRLDFLRPNLDALMKEDVKAAKAARVPLATTDAPDGPTGGEVSRDFADRIARTHELPQAAPRARTTSLAERTEEPAMLEIKTTGGTTTGGKTALTAPIRKRQR